MQRVTHFTPETFAATKQVAGQKRKRQRQALSCFPCRERKVGCDRQKPCSNCFKQGAINKCTYESLNAGNPNASRSLSTQQRETPSTHHDGEQARAAKKADSNVEDRMARLEHVIEELSSKLAEDKGEHSRAISAQRPPSVEIESAVFDQPEVSKSSHNPHAERVLVTRRPGVIYHIGQTGYSMAKGDASRVFADHVTFSRQWLGVGEVCKLFKSWQNETLLLCTSTLPPPDDAESEMLSLIPAREVCAKLIARFESTCNTVHPVVDSDALQSEVSQFWENRESTTTAWRLFYCSVLAIGYQLPVIALPEGAMEKGGRARGTKMLELVKRILFSPGTSSKRPELATFQTLLILILSQSLRMDWVDGNDGKSGLLGLSSRMAFTLGLHRNCHHVRGVPASVAKVRRMLWQTFTFLDMEHAVQCGMPFLYRGSDSDALSNADADVLPDVDVALSSAMPVWARVIHLSHSEKAHLGVSVSEIEQQMAELKFPPSIIETHDAIHLSPQTVGRTLLNCFHHRMTIVLHGPLVDSPSASERARSRAIITDSARAIIDNQALLARLITTQLEPAQTAWAHFILSLTHCNFWYGAESMLGLLRSRPSESTLTDNDALTTLSTLRLAQTLAARALSISPYNVKEYMVLEALIGGAQARLRLPTSARYTPEETGCVVSAMQQAMDRSLEKSKIAIEEAMRSDDPPAALCEDVSPDEGAKAPERGDMAAPADDFCGGAGIEDWTLGADFFSDLVFDSSGPWWGPLPGADTTAWKYNDNGTYSGSATFDGSGAGTML